MNYCDYTVYKYDLMLT